MAIFLYYAYLLLQLYFYVMIITIILSWTPLRNSPIYQMLEKICYPYLGMFRGWVILGNIDFTPMLGLLLYQWLLSLMGNAIN